MHFLPMAYIRDIMIPNTNLHAKRQDPKWKDMDLDEFLHVLGLLLAMEVYEIHGPRRLYWSSNINELFPGMNFEKVMACKRFERITAFLQLSGAIDADQQVLDFVAAVNDNFQKSVSPGSFLTLDESMVKSFHHNLKGKIKIIHKPRPTHSEIKNMADGLSNIVLNMELYEAKIS